MVDVLFDEHLKKNFQKIKDAALKEKLIKQLSKIKDNPEIGKPMRYIRKRTRELHVSPFRLSYCVKEQTVFILDLYHKDDQ